MRSSDFASDELLATHTVQGPHSNGNAIRDEGVRMWACMSAETEAGELRGESVKSEEGLDSKLLKFGCVPEVWFTTVG